MHKIGTFGSTANRFLHLQNCTGFWCKQRQIKMCIVIIQIKYKQPKPGYFWLMRKLVLLSKPWVIIKREDRAKWVVDFQCNSVIVCSNPQTSHTQTHTHTSSPILVGSINIWFRPVPLYSFVQKPIVYTVHRLPIVYVITVLPINGKKEFPASCLQ